MTTHSRINRHRVAFAAVGLLMIPILINGQQRTVKPDIRTYKTVGGTVLKAHVFTPSGSAKERRPAIVLFHGGGWAAGQPEWTYGDAARYAGLGMVAVAIEYRLSDQRGITPLEAMADARDAIRWVRRNDTELGIDPRRVAAYGVSAGGHLAAAAAVFNHAEEDKIGAVMDRQDWMPSSALPLWAASLQPVFSAAEEMR